MVTKLFYALPTFFLCARIIAAEHVVEKEQSQAALPHEQLSSSPQDRLRVPYQRPIGFTLNLGGITSMSFEARFMLGLFRNFSLVLSPNYQNTPELPLYHLSRKQWSTFDIRRFNGGLGVRGHFYEYDSWDGLFIEAMGRGGVTWVGDDNYQWSITPSLMIGYATVYKSGYTISFGAGLEWEMLVGAATGRHSEFLKTAYFGITKLPLMGELSLGWTW